MNVEHLSLAFLLVATLPPIAMSQEIERIVVKPKGEFADIDTSRSIEVIKKLNSKDKDVVTSAIKEITENLDEFAPPVLYAVSDRLFKLDRKEEAAFYFYLGQLRGRSDANKSTDKSARSAISALNMQFGEQINKFAFRELDVLQKTVEKVIAWDREHARHYDARWIALHGLGAFTDSKIAFEPEENWKDIDEQTREEWMKGFAESHDEARGFDKNGDGKLSEEEHNAWRDSYLAKQSDTSLNKIAGHIWSNGAPIGGIYVHFVGEHLSVDTLVEDDGSYELTLHL